MFRTSAGDRSIYEMNHLPSRMMNNRVLVKVSGDYEDGVRISKVVDLVAAGGEWEEAERIVRHGVIAMIPDKLTFRKDTGADSAMEWDTELDVRVGDTVYFGIIASANAEMVKIGDDLYYVMSYSRLILRKRDGVITMLNGYVLLNEVIEKTRVTGLVLDFGDHVDKKSGVVACVGNRNKSYYGSEAIDADVQVGDTVLFEKKFYGYLESDLFAELPKGTGYVQLLWCVATI